MEAQVEFMDVFERLEMKITRRIFFKEISSNV